MFVKVLFAYISVYTCIEKCERIYTKMLIDIHNHIIVDLYIFLYFSDVFQ